MKGEIMNTTQRLQYLEEKLLYQERICDQLSDVLFEQQKQIDKLEEEIIHLRVLLQAEAADSPPENTRPPHY